jgi:hypothetical protein
MRMTLIHNPSAGNARPSDVELIADPDKAGHSVAYVLSKGPDFDRSLEAATDLVEAAARFGSVADVVPAIPAATMWVVLTGMPENRLCRSSQPRSVPPQGPLAGSGWVRPTRSRCGKGRFQAKANGAVVGRRKQGAEKYQRPGLGFKRLCPRQVQATDPAPLTLRGS